MKTLLLLFATFATALLYSQTPIDVTDQTIKIGAMKDELLYFGFAAGDKIVLSFTEINDKELKEIDVSEYPSVSKYADFKTAKIENKSISVNRTGVYQFRFSNGAVTGRICKIHIQRIPATDQTKGFNTSVTWVKKQDTTWNTYTKDVVVGYDTTYRQVTKKELIKTEVKEELLLDKNQRVHSLLNSNGNKTSIFFTLPQSNIETYKTSKVIAWAYWIGVGQEGAAAWEQNAQGIAQLAEGVAAMYTSPLGAYAVGVITNMLIPRTGEDVFYAITDQYNKELFMAGQQCSIMDKGKGTGGFNKFTDARTCKGTYYIVLSNDNDVTGINVSVKVAAIVETNIYEDKEYTEEIVTRRYETKIFSDPVIKTRTVPVLGS
jgi:hypothetical protein